MNGESKADRYQSILKRLRAMSEKTNSEWTAGENLFEIRREILAKLKLRSAGRKIT
jgi:hypothetical protein